MKLAESMLQRGNASVKETAAACGFADPSYFCKVFRRFHGVSPAKFLLHKNLGSDV
jgi:AraC-like DNA-binding protein